VSSVWLSRTLLHPIMSELADARGKSVYNPPTHVNQCGKCGRRGGPPLLARSSRGIGVIYPSAVKRQRGQASANSNRLQKTFGCRPSMLTTAHSDTTGARGGIKEL
jgi:hypothetical protein